MIHGRHGGGVAASTGTAGNARTGKRGREGKAVNTVTGRTAGRTAERAGNIGCPVGYPVGCPAGCPVGTGGTGGIGSHVGCPVEGGGIGGLPTSLRSSLVIYTTSITLHEFFGLLLTLEFSASQEVAGGGATTPFTTLHNSIHHSRPSLFYLHNNNRDLPCSTP